MNIGDLLIPFSLPAASGKEVSSYDYAEKFVFVVFVTCNHCPYSQAYWDRLIKLAEKFEEDNFGLVALCGNDAKKYPQDSFENMVELYKQKKLPFEYLHDEDQAILNHLGATRTPEVFLFNQHRELVYKGAIDDSWENQETVTRVYLEDAVEYSLDGIEVDYPEIPLLVAALNGRIKLMSTSSNKVTLITGASSGIGRSLALKAAKIGYNVGVIARNRQALEALKNEVIDSYNIVFHYHIGDVSKEEDCRAFINGCLDKFGRIDFLFNNAGISMRGIFSDTDLSVIKQLMDVNFWGSVYCTKFALPELLKTKGSVVGVSSIAGFKGLPARTGYSASKFAMQGFLESLRIENLKTGLHVLIACPGYTESNIRKTALNSEGKAQGETPLNEEKLMSADDVAESIWNATLKRRLYLILTAQGKAAVWINKLFPKLADKLTYNVIKKEPNSPFQ